MLELQMEILRFIQSLRLPFLDTFFSLVTKLGEEIAFMAVGMVVFWCIDKFSGYYVLCGGFFGTLLNQFLKITFRIPRPWVLDPSFEIVESARQAATGYSFPSGHTQTSVGLFGSLAKLTKKRWLKTVFIVLCVLIPLSRMYLGVHTPLDVIISVAVALAIVFGFYPLFKNAENSPKIMYLILGVLSALTAAYPAFVCLYPFPNEVYLAENIENLNSAQKNAFTLLGCLLGLITVYFVDSKYIKFETKAVWWAQIIKVAVGLLLVVAAKELLRSPLEAIIPHTLTARLVRYYIMVIIGGILWPLSFKFFAGLGGKEEKTNGFSDN